MECASLVAPSEYFRTTPAMTIATSVNRTAMPKLPRAESSHEPKLRTCGTNWLTTASGSSEARVHRPWTSSPMIGQSATRAGGGGI